MLELHSIELFMLGLHLKDTVVASYGVESERPVTIVRIAAIPAPVSTPYLPVPAHYPSPSGSPAPATTAFLSGSGSPSRSPSGYPAPAPPISPTPAPVPPISPSPSGEESFIEGFGECAALASIGYATESAYSAFRTLETAYIPRLIEWSNQREGLLPHADDLPAIFDNSPDDRMAVSAIEMALIDVWLKHEGASFSSWVGAIDSSADAGAVVGIFGDVDLLVSRVGEYANEGYGRIKIKISPSWDIEPVKSLVETFPNIMFCADANGSYTDNNTDCVDQLKNLDKMGLGFIEQPFPLADFSAASRIAESMDTPICLDESLESLDDIREAASVHAMDVACIKPGRLGGILNAFEALSICNNEGLQAYIGGMYDTGLARRANASLSAIGLTHYPGDTGGGELFIEGDPFGALNIMDGRAELYHGPGIAPMPDVSLMEKVCLKKVEFACNSL